jgi:hypothetical protein
MIIATMFAVVVSLFAEDFWREKPYTQWSQKEVDQILKDSPWAAEITISPEAIFSAMRGAGGGGRAGDDGRGGGRGGFPTGRGGPGGFPGGGERGSGPSLPTMTLLWRSAMPIKQALLRKEMLAGSSSNLSDLDRTETEYMVVLVGIPMPLAPSPADQALEQFALNVDKQKPIYATKIYLQEHEQTVDLFMLFPRTKAIAPQDKEVEVVAKYGFLETKKKFKVKEMMVKGKLEL